MAISNIFKELRGKEWLYNNLKYRRVGNGQSGLDPLNAPCTFSHVWKPYRICRWVAGANGFVIIVLTTMSALLVSREL